MALGSRLGARQHNTLWISWKSLRKIEGPRQDWNAASNCRKTGFRNSFKWHVRWTVMRFRGCERERLMTLFILVKFSPAWLRSRIMTLLFSVVRNNRNEQWPLFSFLWYRWILYLPPILTLKVKIRFLFFIKIFLYKKN